MNGLELLSLLGEIDRIWFTTDCKNVLLVGDINCDFSRPTQFLQSIRTFAEEKGLKIFWNLPDNDRIEEVSYTYKNAVNNITHTSTIDHFLSNERFYRSVTKADVIIHSDNMSGHLPIFCKFDMDQLNLEVEQLTSTPKPSWSKASLEQQVNYRDNLDSRLDILDSPQECNLCYTLHCQNHDASIDEYATGICEAIDNAAKFSLPRSGGVANEKSRGISGWNEYVKPYQAESKFWFGVWQAAGRPRKGELFILQRNAHMQYKYSIRRLKRAKSQILQDKFTQKLLNEGDDIFKEIKKFRGQSTTISNCIDGEYCRSLSRNI